MGRTALLPMASTGGPQIAFKDEDWARFEAATPWTFPPILRQHVQKAWQEYVDEAFFSEPLSDAESRVGKIKKALQDVLPVLRQELTGGTSAAAIYTRGLIKKHLPALPAASGVAVDGPPQDARDFFQSMFADDPVSSHVNVSSICSTVQSYLRASELAEIELKEWRARRKAEGNKPPPDLVAWETLIRRLVDLWEAAGFRASARHDGVSPFVALVLEMQACLPPRFSRTTGDDALSQQISRVLRAIRADRRQRRSMDARPAASTTRQRSRVDLRKPRRSA